MNLTADYAAHTDQIPRFFQTVFADSEGAEEGRTIGALVADILNATPRDDLRGALALDGADLIGCTLFTRLNYEDDPRQVFLMSPVAVQTGRQKSGIGQKLIGFGLQDLRLLGVDFVMTYGDPAYYGKTGFEHVPESQAKPPMPLSMPFGWLGQSLSGAELPIAGPSRCASAFNKPALW